MAKSLKVAEYIISGEPLITKEKYRLYEVFNSNDKKKYILKVFDKEIISKNYEEIGEQLRKFHLLNSKSHNGIIQLAKAVQSRNKLYFFLQRANKGSLLSFLENAKLDEDTIASLFAQIIKGIRTLSQYNLAHRLLTADHILINCEGKVIQAFITGIMHVASIDQPYEGDFMRQHIAPEIKKGESFTLKASVWNLGLLAYQLCTNATIFEKFKGFPNTIKIEDILERHKDITEECKAFISKCLQINPDGRATLDDLLNLTLFDEANIKESIVEGDLKARYTILGTKGKNKNVFIGISRKKNIKVLIKKLSNPREGIRQELQVLSRFGKNPYLPKVVECFYSSNDECYYLVEDYLNGISLDEYIEEAIEKKLNVEEVKEIAEKLALGLKEIHKEGFAHLDLKPESVYLLLNNQSKVQSVIIGNFSTLRKLVYDCYSSGESYFKSPDLSLEQTASLKMEAVEKIKKADIWSYGALLYYMAYHRIYKNSGDLTDVKVENIENIYQRLNKLIEKCVKMHPTQSYSMDNILKCKFIKLGNNEDEKGRYIQGKLIGQGSFGQVYECTKAYTQDKFAMKIVQVVEKKKEDEIKKEIRFLLKCQDSNFIAKYEKCYKQGENMVIIMELFQCDLDKYLEGRNHILTDKEIKLIAKSVAEALNYLHQGLNPDKTKISHRDIKPANILIKYDSSGITKAKIGDLGFAREDVDSMVSQVGSPYFMAPEISKQTGHYNCKVDVWSYGITLFVLASKKRYHQAGLPEADKKELYAKAAKEKIHDRDLAEVVEASLQYYPEQRKMFSDLLKMKYFQS